MMSSGGKRKADYQPCASNSSSKANRRPPISGRLSRRSNENTGNAAHPKHADQRKPPPPRPTSDDSSFASVPPSSLMPNSLWAAALDFLSFREIRSTRFVSKRFAQEIPPHIQHLHIFHRSEMDVPSAQRYSAVRSVNVFCFISGVGVDPTFHLIHPDVFFKAVFFIQAFPSLETTFIGGIINGKRELYHSYDMDYELYESAGDDYADCLNVLHLAIESRALKQNIRFRISHLYFPLHFERQESSRAKLTEFLRSLGASVPNDDWEDDLDNLPSDHPYNNWSDIE